VFNNIELLINDKYFLHNVIIWPRVGPSMQPEHPPLDSMKNLQNKARIVKVSKVLRAILLAGVALWGIGIPVLLFKCIVVWTRPSAIPSATLFGMQLSGVLVLALRFIVTLQLFRFFDRLRKECLFDAKTVGILDVAGRWSIGLWFFQNLQYGVRFYAGLEVFPAPGTWDWNAGILCAGLALIFAAWLLREAQELQEEQVLTV
jgi:hypothetical protein